MAAGRIGWAVLGMLLVAVAIYVSIRNGVAATTAAVVFLFLPTVRWWPLRTAWIPLALLVAFTVWPVWPPLFSAGLGWLIGIAGTRVFGHGAGRVAQPGRLGMRVLGLDLTMDGAERNPFLRRKPGPQAGRASIPRPGAAEAETQRAEPAADDAVPGSMPRYGAGQPGVTPNRAAERPGSAAEGEADADPDRTPRGGEPGVTPNRPATKPESRFPANRTPRAATGQEPKNAAKPKRPARHEPRTEPGPGSAAKPQGGQSP